MSPSAGMMLLKQIVPLIAAAISRGAVKAVGCEDPEELQSEGCALAAAMLDSAEARGKDVPAASVAFYALQQMKTGRRSQYAGRQDAMCPAAALDGAVQLKSLDDVVPVEEGEFGEQLTLHDVLAGSAEDVDVTVARRIDWGVVVGTLDERRQRILLGTAEGLGTNEIAAICGESAPRVCQIRESIGQYVVNAWGDSGLVDVTTPSNWRAGLRAYAERRAGRYERRSR